MTSIADSILQEPIDFTVEVNRLTIFHKLHLKKPKKIFKVYPLCLGTLLLIAKQLMEFKDLDSDKNKGITFDDAVQSIINNSTLLSKTIATAIYNRKYSSNMVIAYFQHKKVERISRFIESNLSSAELLAISNVVIKQMEIEHFLAVLGSMKGLEIAKDNPIESTEKETSGD